MGRSETSRSRSRPMALWAAFALLAGLTASANAADGVAVQFPGRVLWVAGQTLVVATDDSQSVSVDLTHVAQDQYQRLGLDDRVIVTGVLPAEGSRVVGTSIEPLAP
jgi:type 1 fimbria pilin